MTATSSEIYLLSPTKKEGTVYLPMISFSLTATDIDFSSADTLMFTSKQAVISAETLNPNWKSLPCLAIGKATAQKIESLGGRVMYHPEPFYAKVLSQDIVERFKERSILYLRPKEISFDAKSFLYTQGIVLEEQILYKTSCIRYSVEEKPSKNAIIIFTSPSSIYCFLKSFDWDESYVAVLIGEATKEHMPKHAKMYLSPDATIDACILRAKELSNCK